KYVLTTQQLCTFLDYARQHFDVLQIDGLRQFHYRTIYFDSPQFDCFHDHNKGRRKRLKVRFRSYLDHNRHFFEIKLKGRRNVTHKFRVPVDGPAPSDAGLCTNLRQFCNDTLATHYGQALDTEFSPLLPWITSGLPWWPRQVPSASPLTTAWRFLMVKIPSACATANGCWK